MWWQDCLCPLFVCSHSTPLFTGQGDFPWDKKTMQHVAIAAAGMLSAFVYFQLRETGREISWRDFVNHYLTQRLVSVCCFSGLLKALKTHNGWTWSAEIDWPKKMPLWVEKLPFTLSNIMLCTHCRKLLLESLLVTCYLFRLIAWKWSISNMSEWSQHLGSVLLMW